MRNVVLFLILLCTFAIAQAQTQTYFYKCTTHVDKNGVRSARNDCSYWTIVNGQFMYESDKDGNIKQSWLGSVEYRYKGMSNNSYYLPLWLVNHYEEHTYLLVTTDFNTINVCSKLWGTLIWKRTTPQAEADNLPGLIN